MRGAVRTSVSRARVVDVFFLLAVSLVFLGFALYQIDLPGLYGDELDKLVPTVALLNGHPFLSVGWYETVFGFRVLLSFTDRIGAVLSYLPMPFVLLLGYTPLALRLSSIVCALLTLLFAYYGTKMWFGPWTARFGIALCAVSPAYVFLQRMGYYNYGPVTLFTSLTFFFLARYVLGRKAGNLWAAAVFAGIAVNTALQAVFVLIPMAVLALASADGVRRRVREIIIALFIASIVSAPVLITALRTGAMWSRIGWGGGSPGHLTLEGFIDTLSEHVLIFVGMLGGLDEVQLSAIGRHIENPWMMYAFLLAVIVSCLGLFRSRDKKAFLRRPAGALLITLTGLFLTGFILNRDGHISYQLIVLWPFAVLVVGAGFAEVFERFPRSRFAVICLVCALAVLQVNVMAEAHQALSRTGGKDFTSSQIYCLAEYLEGRRESKIIAMEWGLLNQIYYLTKGRILPEALHGWWPKEGPPSPEFHKRVSARMKDDKTVFISFGPGEGLFDRYPHVERLAESLGKVLVPEKTFFERDGSVAYRVYGVIDRDGAQQ
jgi:hypothetical protein